jgi:hypothetical protein
LRHRQMLSWHPTEPAKCFALRPGIANEPAFRRGVSLLGRHGRLLEFTLYPYHAEEVARLALDFPNQTFIVNHCGSPIDRDHAGMLRWKKGLKRLGSAPNIKIKISALTAYDPSRPLKACARSRFIASNPSGSINRCSAATFMSVAYGRASMRSSMASRLSWAISPKPSSPRFSMTTRGASIEWTLSEVSPAAKDYFSVYFLAHSTPSQVSIFVGTILIR